MKCQRCKSDRILSICAKTSDLCSASYKDKEHEGYTPYIKPLGGGDYLETKICMECGQMQGDFPISEKVLENNFPTHEREKRERVAEENQIHVTGPGNAATLLTAFDPSKVRVVDGTTEEYQNHPKRPAGWLYKNNQPIRRKS